MTEVQPEPSSASPERVRQDRAALWWGVLAAALFTAVVALTGRWLAEVPHLSDAGPSWYYWQLPQRTVWGRVSAWGFYALHLLGMWVLIFVAQRRQLRYRTRLHDLNVWALALNGTFAVLHIVQTQWFYDGLAQDVSIWSSQNSVIALLIVVLLLENRRRGLFFGKRVPFGREIYDLAKRYHGYYFSWAIVYTFWYHPTESTSGHLVGFFYMALLMLQGSLFFTRVHTEPRWTLWLELMVFFHGSMVAWEQGAGLLPMFGFGFAGLFVMTQMHGLGWGRSLRALFILAYGVSLVIVYRERGAHRLEEAFRIPIAEYALVFILAGALWLVARLQRVVRARRASSSD